MRTWRIAAEVAGELLQVAGFAGEVELAADDAAKLGDHRLRPIRLRARAASRRAGRGRPGCRGRPPCGGWMPACCTFTTTSSPLSEPGAVHLADRRRGERRRVEVDEQRRRAAASSSVSIVSRTASASSAGTLGLQLLQFLGERHADLVGPRAEDLAELDERRAELFDRQANARFAAEMGERFAVAVFEDALHHGQIEAADPAGEAVLAEDREDLAPAIDVAIDLRDGGDFHARGGRRRFEFAVTRRWLRGPAWPAATSRASMLCGGRGEGRGGGLRGGADFAERPGGPLADRQIGVAFAGR